MKCWKCGKESSEYVSFCESSNQPLAPVAPSVTSPDLAGTQLAATSPIRLAPPIGRTGGWLFLLCISLTIFTPFILFLILSEQFSRTRSLAKTIVDSIMFGAIGIYSFFVGLRLWMKKPKAVREVKSFFIIAISLGPWR